MSNDNPKRNARPILPHSREGIIPFHFTENLKTENIARENEDMNEERVLITSKSVKYLIILSSQYNIDLFMTNQ